MPWSVQHLEYKRPGGERLALDQAFHVFSRVCRRSEFAAHRCAIGDEPPFHVVYRDTDGSERSDQVGQARDVVDVGVSQEDRFDVGLPFAHQVDHQLRLEVGVDHHGVVSRLVFDQIGVGMKLAVSRCLDAKFQSVLRTIT